MRPGDDDDRLNDSAADEWNPDRERADFDDEDDDVAGGEAERGDGGREAAGVRRRNVKPKNREKRYGAKIAAVAAVLALGLVLWSTGPVQAVIKQSFTRVPAAYTELYFTTTPGLDGLDLTVPLTVDAHNINVDSFTLKVWLTNAAGKTDYSTTVKLKPVHGIARTVLNVQLPVDAEILWVNLSGQSRTLHYRVAGSPFPTKSG